MKKVFKFVKGKKDEKKDGGGITPSQSGELLSPAQTPEHERFMGLENSSGYIVDFCGKDKTLTKLHKAAWQGNLEKLKSALKKVEIDAVDRHNRTALHFAVVQGHPNIVWFLLGNNAKTAICDDEGRTPLLKAIECGHKECMTLLLERGTDINLSDYTGNTGLHIATSQGSLDTVSLLLKKGADTEISNNAGDYPLHIATKLENKDLVDLFLNSGASVDVLDRENRTPLMLAAKTGNLLLAQVFFERGAQLTIVDSNGWTAHDYALLGGHESVAASLKALIESKNQKDIKAPESQSKKEEEPDLARSSENSESWSKSKTEAIDQDPIIKKLKEFFRKSSKEVETVEKGEDLPDSPTVEVMPPYCQPPRSWEIIQAGMIDEKKEGTEPKRRSITTLGTLHSRRESFTEGLGATSPKYTLSLNRRKHAKVNNSFAKQRFSFNEEQSLKYWINEDKGIRKDLEKIEFENISSFEPSGLPKLNASNKGPSTSESDWDSDAGTSATTSEGMKKIPDEVNSESGTLGRSGTMHGVEEEWVYNSQLSPSALKQDNQNSWDSEEASFEKDGNFPPPPTALELGVDMAKSIKFMKGISEDHPVGNILERNLWKNAYESHSLDCLEEKDFGDATISTTSKGHARHQSTTAQKWPSEDLLKCQKPNDRLIDVNRRINEQLECYDQALRELAESSTSKNSFSLPCQKTSGAQNYYSLPSPRTGDFENKKTNSLSKDWERKFVDSGPFSISFHTINPIDGQLPQGAENNETLGSEVSKNEVCLQNPVATKTGEKLEKKTKRHMLLTMREVKHTAQVANAFKTSLDDQILSPLTKPEGSFDVKDKQSPVSSCGASPIDENPFFLIGRQETVMERTDLRRKSSSSGTGEEPTLWLQDDIQKKAGPKALQSLGSDENISEISDEGEVKHKRSSSFSPLGIVYREIQKESQDIKKTVNNLNGVQSENSSLFIGEEHLKDIGASIDQFPGENEDSVREPSPDISLSSGPIEPLGADKDSGSEPESSHNDITPTHNYSLKTQHEWLKSHLKAATAEKNKLEEITAQLSEKTERLQYELADAKETAKSRDEVIHLLQGQLARMEAAYTKSLEESVQSRLQLTSHEQEILHLKDLCYKYEEEKDNPETAGNFFEELESRIKALEEEKKKMKEEIRQLEQEKSSLEKRLKEATESEILDQCQRWKERCKEMGEIVKSDDSQRAIHESSDKDMDSEHLNREKKLTKQNQESERKYMDVIKENLDLKLKLQSLASKIKWEKEVTNMNPVCELSKENFEIEARMRNQKKQMEKEFLSKLKGKEEEIQDLIKQLNSERESLIMSYEKKLMKFKSERSSQEIENCRMENERLKEMIKNLQDQVVNIQTKSSDNDISESLKNDLSELKLQCNVISKALAEMHNKDQKELEFITYENLKLKKEINELKIKTLRNDNENSSLKPELLGVICENTEMKNEILDLKNQINSLTMLLDKRVLFDLNLERGIQKAILEQNQNSDQRMTKKREVGKKDELAWSSLYGIKAMGRTRRSRSRSSITRVLSANEEGSDFQKFTESELNTGTELEKEIPLKSASNLEYFELKKEILCLQNRMSDEKTLRHALETQIIEMNLDLKEKENLEQEVYSLKRKIDRDSIQRSKMELIQYQKDLESKQNKYLGGSGEKSENEECKLRCEMLAKEREKSKEIRHKLSKKSKSFDQGGQLSNLTSQVRYHSYPLGQQILPPFTIPSVGLDRELKNRLEKELDKSIEKYRTECSTESMTNVQIELKKKYLH